MGAAVVDVAALGSVESTTVDLLVGDAELLVVAGSKVGGGEVVWAGATSALPQADATATTTTAWILQEAHMRQRYPLGGVGEAILEAVADLNNHLAHHLESDVVTMTPLRGGDVADAYRVDLADGRRVFAKTKRDAPRGFFTTESIGLEWLREADAVKIPKVVHVSDEPAVLVLEWIEQGTANGSTEVDLGRALAGLHSAGAPAFGREDRRSTGSRGLPNEPSETWADFYAANRLIPLARLAADGRALPSHAIEDLEAIAGRIDDLVGEPELPSRLHGDLWGGNRMVGTGGASWLIDPAPFGGHREFDLAMMRLFGGFGEDCFAAYDEAMPLAEGWFDRIPLHQLAPLTVHAIKFGGSYVDATERALARLR